MIINKHDNDKVDGTLCENTRSNSSLKQIFVHQPIFYRHQVKTFTVLKYNSIMTNVQGVLMQWDFKLSTEELQERAQDLIKECREVYDRIGSIPEDKVDVDNVLKALQEVERVEEVSYNYLGFPQHTFPEKTLRDASMEADKKLSEFDVEMSMHQGVFNNLLILQNKNPSLNPEEKRFLEKLITIGKRNGLHLAENVQAEVRDMKKRMSEISIEYQRNVSEVTTFLEFSDEELNGLSDDFIQSLSKTESGKRKVTLKYPHYFPVMRKAENAETRKKLEFAYNTQCIEENPKILEELVSLRHKLAVVLGYKNHADYTTEILMSKSAETVYSFLNGLVKKLKEPWLKEKAVLLNFKKEECERLSVPFDNELHPHDMQYFTTMVEEKLYSVDQDKLKQYFPLPTVTEGLLNIYQILLNLEFEEVKDPIVWHPDVQLYSVKDKSSQESLGCFFMDLFPREGKYGHAACFPLQPRCLLPDGKIQVPVAALVTNFSKATPNKPSLLDHKEVETFFHEFGHVMHHICSKATISHFSGTKVERDFVEAPSQMLENWCWAKEPLLKMSGHYKDGSRIPEDILQALIKSQLANVAHFNIRQLTLGLFDHTIHIRPEVDTAKVFLEVSNDVSGIKPSVGTNFAAHFGHLAAGYDARYYSYMWSEVYSMDMFVSRFKKEGLLNQDVGIQYRNKVLAIGGTKDAFDMLRDFLGREPNEDAFLISKGLTSFS